MNIEELILTLREKHNAGLGRIFKEVRDLSEHRYVGDIILYKKIINTLHWNDYTVSKRSITRHFQKINPDDYDLSEKREIIRDLKKYVRKL